ncbi:hypothetical protein [Metabacillus bambusae]|uniref:Uncharacterized protein n=1 Tax=Metabacillus bambusae TaxID=2795218 RepID=A0ABS3N0G1_9BACI|nr:hypothetical protein [Metabacillus bambusae]MBO1511388.1 hypothetical protein [Metabacillus bambusae]
MTDVNKVIFPGGSIKTSEDLQYIRDSVEEKEFDMLVIDKKSLLSLFDYIDKLGSLNDKDDDIHMNYDING